MGLKIFILLIALLSFNALALDAEKNYEMHFESLNQEIQKELLYGDLSQKSVRKKLLLKIKDLKIIAASVHGKRFSLLLSRSFKQTLQSLSRLDKTHKEILDMRFENGLTGREVIVRALDPKTFDKLQAIHEDNKQELTQSLGAKALPELVLQKTLQEVKAYPEFDFLNLTPERNYVLAEGAFNFFATTCRPAFGEEDFFLALFGFERCQSDKYELDRYTIGLGYINAITGHSYMTGLKIGKKSFFGVGARVKIGISYAGGIGVFIGNGLVITLDLDRKTYGLYAGATFAHLKVR